MTAWIWKASVDSGRTAKDLLVRADRENLRASPAAAGRLLGTVLRGTRLVRLSDRGRWVKVRYDGWIWQPSLADASTDRSEASRAGPGGGEEAMLGTPASAAPEEGGEASLPGADRTVSVAEENLRAEPAGRRLGVLRRGADLATLGTRGSWVRVAVRGSFWAASANGAGSTRTVGPPSENLRQAPASEIVGVLARGAPLAVVGRDGRWLDVQLEGWIWASSTLAFEPLGGPGTDSTGEPKGPVRSAGAGEASAPRDGPPGDGGPDDVPSGAQPAGAAGAATEGAADPAETASPPRVLSRSVPLKDAPEGVLIGQALTGGSVVPLRTAGDWVKVRLEGWMPRDALAASIAPSGPVTVAMVTSAPDAYRGAEVTWRLELIAVETADASRTDFRPGERYLLTRSATGEREYVYVVIPDRLAERFERLAPLTPLTVRGLVRTGRSALVGNPVLELRELVRTAP
jgi:hypothetical protein